MANEQRLIDANKISYHKSGFPKGDGCDSGLDWAFREDIDKLPTVDAVEVVRCKDCRFSYYWETACVRKCHTKNGTYETVGDYDFCSRGERND